MGRDVFGYAFDIKSEKPIGLYDSNKDFVEIDFAGGRGNGGYQKLDDISFRADTEVDKARIEKIVEVSKLPYPEELDWFKVSYEALKLATYKDEEDYEGVSEWFESIVSGINTYMSFAGSAYFVPMDINIYFWNSI